TKGQELKNLQGQYASGQIHIDSKGFRSWGPDHHYRTSICQ
ncbi:peptidase M15, partial [Acinetobacter nosocomialis]